MSINTPDHDLEDLRVVSSPQELRAMTDPLRAAILELLLERAATVGELAAVDRPTSTVAYHVGVLVDAGMLWVVRTRKVRAIDERFSGRTARIFFSVDAIGQLEDGKSPVCTNALSVAASGLIPAHEADDDLRTIIRHARIPRGACRGVLGARFRAHPRVHAAAALRRDGLRVRRRSVPDRVPHLARTRGGYLTVISRCGSSAAHDEVNSVTMTTGRTRGWRGGPTPVPWWASLRYGVAVLLARAGVHDDGY